MIPRAPSCHPALPCASCACRNFVCQIDLALMLATIFLRGTVVWDHGCVADWGSMLWLCVVGVQRAKVAGYLLKPMYTTR